MFKASTATACKRETSIAHRTLCEPSSETVSDQVVRERAIQERRDRWIHKEMVGSRIKLERERRR